MHKEETIKVLYNTCYGELRPSNKAIELYNLRMKEIDPNFILIDNIENTIDDLLRHDPILIEIYYEIGKEFDGKYSNAKIGEIPKKYEKYYYIRDYDGFETLIIDYSKYELNEIKNKIREILKSNITNDEKISQLNKFI
jgi:hypothetical protein